MDYFLLPPGFADHFFDEAEKLSDTVQALLTLYRAQSYRLVDPPLMEFEDTLLAGHGKTLANQTFRLMDPLSHRMLGLRADLTAQVIRIASSRLKDTPRPLRLCYAGDVVRAQRSKSIAPRQMRQIGCEMIGSNSAEADAEIIRLAAGSLHSLGIQNITVDLTMGALINNLCCHYNLDSATIQQVRELLIVKNKKALAELGHSLFAELLNITGPADQALKKLQTLELPPEIQNSLQPLYDVVVLLPDLSLSIDLLEHYGFEYYSGLSFSLLSNISKEELGRGGRYNVPSNDEIKESGTGFSLNMEAIMAIKGQ